MSSLPHQAAEKGAPFAPLQLSPCRGQSLCEEDEYEHSVPAWLCRPTGLALARHLQGRVFPPALGPPPPASGFA